MFTRKHLQGVLAPAACVVASAEAAQAGAAARAALREHSSSSQGSSGTAFARRAQEVGSRFESGGTGSCGLSTNAYSTEQQPPPPQQQQQPPDMGYSTSLSVDSSNALFFQGSEMSCFPHAWILKQVQNYMPDTELDGY